MCSWQRPSCKIMFRSRRMFLVERALRLAIIAAQLGGTQGFSHCYGCRYVVPDGSTSPSGGGRIYAKDGSNRRQARRRRSSCLVDADAGRRQPGSTICAFSSSKMVRPGSPDAIATAGQSSHSKGEERGGERVRRKDTTRQHQQEKDFMKMLLAQMDAPRSRRQALMALWESDLPLDSREYLALLENACKLGWVAMASTILDEMVADDIPITYRTYAVAIRAACRENHVRLVLLLIMDQHNRAKENHRVKKQRPRRTKSGGGDGVGLGAPAVRVGKMSDTRQHILNVLTVTMRAGDVHGSIEVLKYMKAVGMEATPRICQPLLLTVFNAGGADVARIPSLLHAIGNAEWCLDMSLMEVLELLFEARRPEIALEVLLDATKRTRVGGGKNNLWAEGDLGAGVFAAVLTESEKLGRIDVIRSTIESLLTIDQPLPLTFTHGDGSDDTNRDSSDDDDMSCPDPGVGHWNGNKELERSKKNEVLEKQRGTVVAMNEIVSNLATRGSGNAAAVVLDRWRALALGGGGDVGDKAGIAPVARPTETSYRLTMAALVRSGQWGRARSLLEVMTADGIEPSTASYSTLLALLLNRLQPRPSSTDLDVASERDLTYLWAEPTYEWDEVLFLIRNARAAARVTVTADMYVRAIAVLQCIASRSELTALGMAPSAPPPPPPAIFLDKAVRLVNWAIEDGVDVTPDMFFSVMTLAHVARDAERVFSYFDAMLAMDGSHRGSLKTYSDGYTMAVDACIWSNNPDRALTYVRGMRQRSSFRPTVVHYEKAVRAMAAGGRYRDAYQLLAEAVEAGSSNIGVYNAAVAACAMEGNTAQAETVVKVMVDMGLKPASETMSHLLLTYGASGDVDGICSVMARAGQGSFSPGVLNALVYESLLKVLAPLHAWTEAEAFVKDGERVLPGSLSYRTYGYLMVAYAAEKQWGAAIELAMGEGRWPETSGIPGERFHPPELRETACAVALKWLLTRGSEDDVPANSVDAGVGVRVKGIRDRIDEDGEEEEAFAVAGRRALEFRRCGRELFVRMLASGTSLNSVRIIKAALGGVGAKRDGASTDAELFESPSSTHTRHYQQGPPYWSNAEERLSGDERNPLSASCADWLIFSLSKDQREAEISEQALHVSAVLEVFLKAYAESEQGKALRSPSAVWLLQQGVSAACWVHDPDLAERLFEAWLGNVDIAKRGNERLRRALRLALSEVLAGFFAEGEGRDGAYRGLSLIGRCQQAGLSPNPYDFLGAMRACNTAGLFGAALQLFDKLYAITDPASESERSGIDFDYESEAGFDSDISESDSPSDDSSTEQSTNVEDGSDAGGGIMGEDSWAGFEELHDVPDGELIPAAAAAIALESCFLGGNRSRAMEIVWQLIRRRHPLTEACRNRAIVALTEGGQADMALELAKGMEIDDHYTDPATLEFVEKFHHRLRAAIAGEGAESVTRSGGPVAVGIVGSADDGDEEAYSLGEKGFEDDARDEEYRISGGKDVPWDTGVIDQDGGGDSQNDDSLAGASSSRAGKARIAGLPRASPPNRPSELVIRFLPLLEGALRSRLRPQARAALEGGNAPLIENGQGDATLT